MKELLCYLVPCLVSVSLTWIVLYQCCKEEKKRPSLLQIASAFLMCCYLTVVFAMTVSPVFGFSLSYFARSLNLVPLMVCETISVNPTNFWGNMLMFMPFGFLQVFLSRRTWKWYYPVLSGLLLSLLIEVLQLFSMRGTDVDDLILNTVGAVIGYALARLLIARSVKTQKLVHTKSGWPVAVSVLFGVIGIYIGGFAIVKDRAADDTVVMDITSNQSPAAETLSNEQIVSVGQGTKSEEESGKPSIFSGESLFPWTKDSNEKDTTSEKDKKDPDFIQTDSVDIMAGSACIYDTSSSKIIYEKNADESVSPASITKLLTALTALDYCKEDETVVIGEELLYIHPDCSVAGFRIDQEVTVKALLEGLLLPSGADAAYALAAYAGNEILIGRDPYSENSVEECLEAFVNQMNTKATEIGMIHSAFTNPDGYDEEGQYVTALDLIELVKKCSENETIADITASPFVTDRMTDGTRLHWDNSNEFLLKESSHYDVSCIGMKTGYTSQAGGCLASVFRVEGRKVYFIVLGSGKEERFTDTEALVDAVAEHK